MGKVESEPKIVSHGAEDASAAILKGLNPPQKEAARTLSGPLLILAGAGSGKTRTLTCRIANLIAHGVRPQNILAVTFTNKAANEMKSRLDKLLREADATPKGGPLRPTGSNGREVARNDGPTDWYHRGSGINLTLPYMGTFHSVCVKILRMEHLAAGLSSNFVIYDTDDQVALIKRIIKNGNYDSKNLKPKGVQSTISRCKNEYKSPSDLEKEAYYPNLKATAKIYAEYEKLKTESDALDFDDLLLRTARLFEENKELKKKWQERFQHILIDEYQDTNAVQYHLVKALVNKEQNICVVGDDWQSIYSWRGADYTNILNFTRDFPEAKVIKLEQNYRSTGNILKASQKIINNNVNRTEKTLFTEAGEGAPIEIESLGDEEVEASWVARQIARKMVTTRREYSDFAVLYRTNAQSYAFEKAFIAAKIPYKIVGGVRFYDRKEIKDALAILKLVVNPKDSVSLERVCKNVLSGIGDASVVKIRNRIEEILMLAPKSNPLLDPELPLAVSARARKSVERLQRYLEQMTTTDQLPTEIVKHTISYFDFQTLLDDGTPSGEDRLENLNVLIGNAIPYERLEDFLADAALMSSADETTEKHSVTLMTLHAAKGLEFPVVYIVGLEEGLFPTSRVDNPEDLEEERRLAYVGMTRAKEELTLTYAKSRFSYGSRSYTQPSRFLLELGYNPYGSNDWNDVDDEVGIPKGFDDQDNASVPRKSYGSKKEFDPWEDGDGYIDDPFPEDVPVFE